MNSIFDRILAGEDPEKVGKELVDELNKAVAEKKKKDEEAKKIAATKQEREDTLNEYAGYILNNLLGYLEVADPAMSKGVKEKGITVEDMREILDSVLETVEAYKNLGDLIENAMKERTSIKVTPKKASKPTPEAVFAKFLKDAGLN